MTILSRDEKRQNFIFKNLGANVPQCRKLAADASSRTYWRICLPEDKTLILLDDESGRNKCDMFVKLSNLLCESGVRAPKVVAADLQDHFLLLEDFGDGTFTRLLNTQNEKELYSLGTEALVKISKINKFPTDIGQLDAKRIVSDIMFLLNDYYPLVFSKPAPTALKERFEQIVKRLLPMAFLVPNGLVLWDYHVDNLMMLENGDCGVLDFQDALVGPLSYDIMSLVEDARREVSPEVAAEMKEKFYRSLTGVSQEDFEASFKFMSMFRHMRVLGRFADLYVKSGKDRYLAFMPHVWKMLEKTLEFPPFSEMRAFVDEVFAPKIRPLVPKRAVNQAFLLAAGRGVRMAHLTDNCPKPLVKVGSKALIDYNFEKLARINIKQVTVNVCYLGEQIKAHLQNLQGFNLQISEETEALETGGGIKKALPMLKNEPILVLNSDTFWLEKEGVSSLEKLVAAWDEEKFDIVLLLQPLDKIVGDAGIGNYKIVNGHPQRNIAAKTEGFPYLFTGASIVHPKVFADAPDGKFSLRDLFDKAEAQGRLGYTTGESVLFHVGTPKALDLAEKYLQASE